MAGSSAVTTGNENPNCQGQTQQLETVRVHVPTVLSPGCWARWGLSGRRSVPTSGEACRCHRSCSLRWARPPHKDTCRVISRALGSRDRGARCWSQLPRGAEATGQSGGGRTARSHYLLRLTGRLSLVCACFFLLQPVRLYWWCPRLPTGGRTPPLPTEL